MFQFKKSGFLVLSAVLVTACGGSSRGPDYRPPVPASSPAPEEAQAPQAVAPEKPKAVPSGAPAPTPIPVVASAAVVKPEPPKDLSLHLQLMSSGRSDSVPRVVEESVPSVIAFNQKLKPEPVAQGRYVFDELLVLPRGGQRPLFFVVGPVAFGKEISDAYVSLQVESKEGVVRDQQKEVQLRYQPVPARWYFDLSYFFPVPSNVDPNETQKFRLRLIFSDQSQFEGTIEFRAWGGLPGLELSSGVHPKLTEESLHPIQFVRDMLADGWPVYFDWVKNPSARSMRIWYRMGARSPWLQSVTVNTPGYRNYPYPSLPRSFRPSEPADPIVQCSEARFYVEALHLENRWENAEPGRWSYLDLAPGKEIELAWYARRDASFPVIQLERKIAKVSWRSQARENDPLCVSQPDRPDCAINTQILNVTPEPAGAWIRGIFDHEVRIAEPSLSRELATADDLDPKVADQVVVLVHGDQTVELERNSNQHGKVEVAWQGVPTL